MRVSLSKATEILLNQWMEEVGEEVDKDDLRALIELEMIVYSFECAFPHISLSLENVHSIFPNHDTFLKGNLFPGKIEAVRYYFHEKMSKLHLHVLIEKYGLLPEHWCLYHYDADANLFKRMSPSVVAQRIEMYENILDPEYLKHENVPVDFVQEGDIHIRFYGKFNETDEEHEKIRVPTNLYGYRDGRKYQTKESHIPARWMTGGYDSLLSEGESPQLSSKVTNKDFTLSFVDMKELARKMNAAARRNHTGNGHSRDWVQAEESIKINPIHPLTKDIDNSISELKFDKSFSMAGMVGAGKTTFILMMAYYITQEKNGRVGIVTGKTSETFERVMQLRELGIKAVPIFSPTEKEKHMQPLMKSVSNKAVSENREPLSAVIDHQLMKYYGSKCLIQTFSKSVLSEKDLPCESLVVKDKETNKDVKKVCPLFQSCGVFQYQLELEEADVWVGTVQALSKSCPKKFVDSQNRPYLSLMKDRKDVIFVDESDSIQESFDGLFNHNVDLFGDDKSTFDSFYQKGKRSILSKHLTANDLKINLFSNHLETALLQTRFVYGLLSNSKHMRKEINKQSFGVNQILSRLVGMLFETKDEELINQNGFYQHMKELFSGDRKSKRLSPYLSKISNDIRLIKMGQMQDVIELSDLDFESLDEAVLYQAEMTYFRILFESEMAKVMDNIPDLILKKGKSNKNMQRPIELFAFLHYLETFEQSFRNILLLKDYAQQVLGEKFEDIESRFVALKEFLPFIPEPATARTFQYRYEASDKYQKVGKFSMFSCQAIGRHLLTNLQTLSSQLDGVGSCLVYLSGTSYANGSANYHLEVPVKYALESTIEKKSTIRHFSRIVLQDDKPIFVSGTPFGDKKDNALGMIAKEMVPVIKEELEFWKVESEGETNKRRKVLLVTNSYNQVQTVVKELKPHFGSRVKGLSKYADDVAYDLKEAMILPSEVEQVPYRNVDILVVPLLSINRGYNILVPDSNSSYFGSVFFLVRPYPVYSDTSNIINVLNGLMPKILKQTEEKGLYFGEAVSHVRRQANILFEEMISNGGAWVNLQKNQKEILAWYTFVNVWQMTGRLVRGNTDARIHYVDGKFHVNGLDEFLKGQKTTPTLLDAWGGLLDDDHSYLANKLYEPFMKHFKQDIVKVRNHYVRNEEDVYVN